MQGMLVLVGIFFPFRPRLQSLEKRYRGEKVKRVEHAFPALLNRLQRKSQLCLQKSYKNVL